MSDFVAPNGAVSVAEAWTKRTRRVTATYLALTKPRVVELLLVTTVPAMVLADRGLPSLALIAAVLVGGALAAGGANTINCWIERDRDQLMRRTRHRPLPTGAIDPAHALVFGLVLEVAAFAILWTSANLLAASLAIAATVFYVFVYTIWLKPRTVQNIVIGGAAGAVPVLVGWAAVTGSLALPALVLFAVVFCWTPAHFWALALRYREDYAAAGFPMLPVVRGPAVAASQIFAYAAIVSLLTLTLPLVTTMGILYWVAAGLLGLVLTAQAFRLRRGPSEQRAIAFFGLSNTYLALLFAAVALDTLLRAH